MAKKRSVAKDILAGLQQFSEDLKSGKPIPATRIQRVETPDGPMHLRKRIYLHGRKEK